MAHISTHVLDLARGRPAADLAIELRFDGSLLRESRTNQQGRTNEPLVHGDHLDAGDYELVFHAGDYLRAMGQSAPSFFDIITIRFHVDDPAGTYHVPLLLSPYGYSTYRGS
jgi:5-hydroxyisourate hydrolase